MRTDVASDYLKNDGRIWVQTISKYYRPATDREQAVIQKNAGRNFTLACAEAKPARLH
jgi:hypothetical protein